MLRRRLFIALLAGVCVAAHAPAWQRPSPPVRAPFAFRLELGRSLSLRAELPLPSWY